MKTSKHSESEIIKAINQLESGMPAEQVARDHGISRAALYKWKKRYGGLEVSQLKRLKELEQENARLKRMYADVCLDNQILKEVTEEIVEDDQEVMDVLQSHRKFRVLNVIDDFNREVMGQKVATSIPGERLIRMLEEIIWEHGKPNNIRSDNGPEFTSKVFQEWCKANGINQIFIQPGAPTQNSYIERFNGSYRRGVLDAYILRTLDEVRTITEEWMEDYNNKRPHESLGNMPPVKYREIHTQITA